MNPTENPCDDQNPICQTTLDQMVSTDTCQMLKAAIPYMPCSGRQFLSLYVKIQELVNTAALFSPQNRQMEICQASAPDTDPLSMINDIRRFCYGESRKKLDSISNIMVMLQMIQLMRE